MCMSDDMILRPDFGNLLVKEFCYLRDITAAVWKPIFLVSSDTAENRFPNGDASCDLELSAWKLGSGIRLHMKSYGCWFSVRWFHSASRRLTYLDFHFHFQRTPQRQLIGIYTQRQLVTHQRTRW